MGFFDKLKNFGSKIINGVRKGWDWAKNKVAPIVRKVWGVAKPIADTVIPGSKPITDAIQGFGEKFAKVTGI